VILLKKHAANCSNQVTTVGRLKLLPTHKNKVSSMWFTPSEKEKKVEYPYIRCTKNRRHIRLSATTWGSSLYSRVRRVHPLRSASWNGRIAGSNCVDRSTKVPRFEVLYKRCIMHAMEESRLCHPTAVSPDESRWQSHQFVFPVHLLQLVFKYMGLI